MSERRILYVTATLRGITTSLVGILIGPYLARLGMTGRALGGVISLGLAGAALAAIVATFLADRIGRRRFLMAVTTLSMLGTLTFAFVDSELRLGAAAFVGMLNGMGRDRGAALVAEQAALPSTTTNADRTRVIAWYTMLQDVGHAVGAMLAGLPTWLGPGLGARGIDGHRFALLLCAGAGLVAIALYARLGSAIDNGTQRKFAVLPKTRVILVKISALFAVDSVAGGFLTAAMLSFFFFERFGVSEAVIGALFFGARLMNAASHLGAAWLAKRIGLVRTMVLTHIPSSLLLLTVAFAPSFPVAAALFLIREGLVEMDVPTRQSYVLALVQPEERTFASGVTNLVRLVGWAVAPAFAGLVMRSDSLYLPLVIGAGMKIAYDVMLWLAFRRVRPPEETNSVNLARS